MQKPIFNHLKLTLETQVKLEFCLCSKSTTEILGKVVKYVQS